MKKLLTLALLLALNTAISAQYLMRNANIEDKKGTTQQRIIANMDTMRHIHFALAYRDNRNIDGQTIYLDIGDGQKWTLLGENASRVVTAQSTVRLLNLMTDLGWEFQLPLNDLYINQGTGGTMTSWLFKRKQ